MHQTLEPGLFLKEEGYRVLRKLGVYPSGCPYSQHLPKSIKKIYISTGAKPRSFDWITGLAPVLSFSALPAGGAVGRLRGELSRQMRAKLAECRAEQCVGLHRAIKHVVLWNSPGHNHYRYGKVSITP